MNNTQEKPVLLFHCVDEITGTEWFDSQMNDAVKTMFYADGEKPFLFTRYKFTDNTEYVYNFTNPDNKINTEVLVKEQLKEFYKSLYEEAETGMYFETFALDYGIIDNVKTVTMQPIRIYSETECKVTVHVKQNGKIDVILSEFYGKRK